MSRAENATELVRSVADYDLVLNRDSRKTVQRITSLQKSAAPEFQARLR